MYNFCFWMDRLLNPNVIHQPEKRNCVQPTANSVVLVPGLLAGIVAVTDGTILVPGFIVA